MNRRWFLSSLATAAAGMALDPERLLWRPTKTIFIPPPPLPKGVPYEAAERAMIDISQYGDRAVLWIMDNDKWVQLNELKKITAFESQFFSQT